MRGFILILTLVLAGAAGAAERTVAELEVICFARMARITDENPGGTWERGSNKSGVTFFYAIIEESIDDDGVFVKRVRRYFVTAAEEGLIRETKYREQKLALAPFKFTPAERSTAADAKTVRAYEKDVRSASAERSREVSARMEEDRKKARAEKEAREGVEAEARAQAFIKENAARNAGK
jgi:hypothetical protein